MKRKFTRLLLLPAAERRTLKEHFQRALHSTYRRPSESRMSLPDFERVEKLLRFGSIICGLSLIPRSVSSPPPPAIVLFTDSVACSGVFGLLNIFDPMYMVVSGANHISKTFSNFKAPVSLASLLRLTYRPQPISAFLALSSSWRKCAMRACTAQPWPHRTFQTYPQLLP